MSKAKQRHDSFVFRIWWEDEGVSRVWRGWIQHASSGEIAYVRNFGDLLAFVETYTGSLVQRANAAPDRNQRINSKAEEDLK